MHLSACHTICNIVLCLFMTLCSGIIWLRIQQALGQNNCCRLTFCYCVYECLRCSWISHLPGQQTAGNLKFQATPCEKCMYRNVFCWFCWKIIWFSLNSEFFKTKCASEALLERLRLEGWLVLFMWGKNRGDFRGNGSICIIMLILVQTELCIYFWKITKKWDSFPIIVVK